MMHISGATENSLYAMIVCFVVGLDSIEGRTDSCMRAHWESRKDKSTTEGFYKRSLYRENGRFTRVRYT
jgi:hypothetical protein